ETPVMTKFELTLSATQVNAKRLSASWVRSCKKYRQNERYSGYEPAACGETTRRRRVYPNTSVGSAI
ncbi:MAG: hypothetical protein AABX74_01640, partial [Nanoarchaeota archaeon]